MAGFGGAVKLTGESEYRKALKEIQVNLKEVSSEMKLVSAQYDKNDTSTEALKAKSEALAKQLTAQKTALSSLQAQYTKLSAEQEKNKSKHDALVAEYEKEQAELKRIGDELGTSSQEYKAQAVVVSNLAKDVDKSSQANIRNEQTLAGMRTEMNGLKTSIATTESEITKADNSTEELADATKDAGEQAKNAGEGFTVFKGVLANLASSAIQGAMNGLKNLGSAMINVGKQAISSYADYEQLSGGVETLFKDSADVVERFASNAYQTAGMSANQYMETVTSFSASLISSLGGDTEKASQYANRAITDMSDNANKMGTDIGMIQNAYQGFAKQNYTMLDNLKLGYGGTKEEMQRLLADAEKISGFKYDISSYADIVDAIHVVQDEMGITGTTAREASETISGSLSMAQASWSNLLTGIADDNADFGQLVDDFVDSVLTVAKNLIPRIQTTITGLASMASGLLEKLVPQLVLMIPPLIQQTLPVLLSAVQSAISSILAVLPSIISTISKLIPEICSSLISQLPLILSSGIDIINSLIGGISSAIPSVLALIPSLISELVATFSDNLGSIIDTGTELLLSLSDGILSALPDLISQIPFIISKLVSAIISNLPKILEMGIKLTISLANGIIKATPELLKLFPSLIKQIGVELKNNFPLILENGKSMLKSLLDGAKSMFGNLVSLGGELVSKWLTALKDLPNQMLNIGKNIVNGMINGVKNMASKAVSAVKDLGKSLVNGVKGALGIHSPSTVFAGLGEMSALGYVEGFSDEMKNATSEMQDAIPTSFDTLTASGLPTNSLTSTGGLATSALVEAFKTAMAGMEIEMGEDGFAQFVVKTISKEIYQ